MNKVIKGKKYDTATATEMGYDSYSSRGDFNHWCETLYRKETGEFFLHGEGGPLSKYAKTTGLNEWSGGEKIIPLSLESAQKWAEEHLSGDEYEKVFGLVEDEKISVKQTDERSETRYSFHDSRTNEEKTFTSLSDMLKACGYFAFKLWCADDIVEALESEAFDKLDRNLTPNEENKLRQMAKSVADTLSRNGIDALTDCTDEEWDSLIDAAKGELGKGWLKEVTAPNKAKKEKNKKTAR